jgi:hypothetical protein
MHLAPGSDLGYAHAVSAWAAHLRSGGTTPWANWRPAPDALDHVTVLEPVPDAIHLELVRLLNLAAPDPGALTGLADRVLATASPGRGLLDVPLPWPAEPRRFGTPAIDPTRLPREQLVRLAVGVLARLLAELPTPPAGPMRPPLPLPWRRRFRLHGPPATVAAVRRMLLAQGYVETDWRPTHVVIARPVEVMMAEHWASTVRAGGTLKWATAWHRAEGVGRLPGPIDVAAIADRLRDRPREPLHVVVARDADRAAALTARVLRARHVTLPPAGDQAISDLLRRLNRLVGLTRGPGHIRDAARTLAAVLERDDDPSRTTTGPSTTGAALLTPLASLAWARQVAASTAEALREAGYPVHGDPVDLAPTDHTQPGTIDRQHTLELALTALLRTWPPGGHL